MAGDRVIKVSLVAQVSNYVAGMEQARKSTVAAGTSAEQAKAKFEQQNQAMTQIGTGLLAIGAVAAVGVGLAIKKFSDFDAAMSEVQASTHESTANMGLLRDAAMEAGASTVFTASEAANAIDELAKAGVSTADVLGGALAGSLDLASAGGLGVAEAASIAATALTQFKLKGSEIPHVADLLAAGAGKAQGSVDDLGQALKQGGLVASQAGLSLDETTGALAAFASAGLIGSDAGTSLKTMLLALEKPSTQAQAALDQYGISVYDSQGKMLDMAGIAGQLQTKLGGLTDEQRNSTLATIFGTDAVRSASVLYDQGAKGIQSWNDKVNDAGYAAETARIKLDNLNGDIEKFGGAVDTAFIKSGSAANDSLRMLTQLATGAVDAVGSLPGPVLAVGLGLGVVTAATALVGGGMLTLIPKIAATKLAMHDMGMTAGSLAKSIGKGGLLMAALTVATVAMSGMGRVGELAAEDMAKLNAALGSVDSADSLNSLFTGMQGTTVATNGLVEAANKLTSSGLDGFVYQFEKGVFGATDAVLGWIPAVKDLDNGITKNEAQFKSLGTTLATLAGSDMPSASKQFNEMVKMMGGGNDATEKLLKVMPDYKAALIEQAGAAGIVVTGTDEAANKTNLLEYAQRVAAPTALDAADAYLAVADEAAGLNDQVRTLIDTMNEANGIGQDAISKNISYQDALRDVDEQIKNVREGVEGYAKGLDVTTAAGAQNLGMLNDLAGKSQDAAQAQFDLDGNTANYKKTLEAGHKAVIDRAIALGTTKDEANKLADAIYNIPTEKSIRILANTADAARTINDFIATYGRLSGTIMYRATLPDLNGVASGNGRMGTFAGGGFTGGGGKYEPAGIVHRGEFVSTSETTATPANRAALEFMNRGGVINGYAGGGYVQPVQYMSSGGGGSAVSVSSPVVSLAGATFAISIEGRQMTAVIQEQIVSASDARAGVIRRGVQG